MRTLHFAFLGLFGVCVGAAAACGGTTAKSSGATGSGGGSSSSSGTGGVEDAGSDGADAAVDATSDGPIPGYPGAFPAPPQVVDLGGPVLKKPRLVPIFFAGDDATFQGQLEDFIAGIGSTAYWEAAVGEYGVGPATALPPVQLTEMAPATIDDTAIQTWLQGKLNGNDPAWPANDANTVYVLHYPLATTITLQGSSSCTAFGGYHNDTQLDAAHKSAYVAYAVVPRCMSFPPLTGIDAVTGAESHELAEACTDPYPQDNPAYVTVDDAHFEWERVLGGGEVGDMCAQFPGSFTKFPPFAYTVQRIWSNKQAKAGNDPCQPTPSGEVYFNSAPVLPDQLMLSIGGQMVAVTGVEIPLGQSKTIDVQLFSDAPTSGPWTVSAENSSMTPSLGFAFDKTTGMNGDTLHLTITVNTAGRRGSESFLLKSTLGTQETFWVGIVGTPAVTDGGVEGGPGFDAGNDAAAGDAGDDAGGDGGDGG
jgi:hypothetical protein